MRKEEKRKEGRKTSIGEEGTSKGQEQGQCCFSTSCFEGQGQSSAVPARQFVMPRAEGHDGDDSEEESPAKPMSSRPSKNVRSDDSIGFTPGAVAVFSQNLVFQRLEEIKQLENASALLADNNPAKRSI